MMQCRLDMPGCGDVHVSGFLVYGLSLDDISKHLSNAVLLQGLREKKLVEANLEKVERLRLIAKELDCTLAQLALAWCARNPNVSTVITGASKPSQVWHTHTSACLSSLPSRGDVKRKSVILGFRV
jgi:aryl-alcohol dehydrogenase-like predicted oxidoreductase